MSDGLLMQIAAQIGAEHYIVTHMEIIFYTGTGVRCFPLQGSLHETLLDIIKRLEYDIRSIW
jgi:hypothetical protein